MGDHRLAVRGPGRWGLGATGVALVVGAAWLMVREQPTPAMAATFPPLDAKRAAVATDHALASAAALSALRAGGTAADAACAAALALGVVSPSGSGLGGGGFALVWIARERRAYVVDFRERAPAAATAEMMAPGPTGVPPTMVGGLAVAVPGEARGLGELVRRWGRLPWSRCVEPAEKLARGAPISPHLADAIRKTHDEDPSPDPTFNRLFRRSDLRTGSTFRRPDLAWTLARLRRDGPDGFYRGDIAEEIVRAVRLYGGVLTADDLARYRAVDRPPVDTRHVGLRVLGVPPPSAGGVGVAEALGIMEEHQADLWSLGRDSSASLHLVAEALKHAFADRARHLGDPDLVVVPTDKLTNRKYWSLLAETIKDRGVLPADAYGSQGTTAAPARDAGTSHISVVDQEGNAVALTTTINLRFGSRVVAGKTGVLLNDEMDDFSRATSGPNAFGLMGSGAGPNGVAPDKRPLSSMAPTIVLDGDQVKLVAGAAGGPAIVSTVVQLVVDVLDHRLDAQAAVSSPRVHTQWRPEQLQVEREIPRDVLVNLEMRGHKLELVDSIGAANLIVRVPEGGLQAASDPRRPGAAPAGY